MKVCTHSSYSYVHIVEIPKTEIEKIDLVMGEQPKETLGNYYNRQTDKPDVLINAGFFVTRTGDTIFNLVDDGKVYSTNSSYKWGIGITNEHKDIKYGSIANANNKFVDFVSGYPPLVDNGVSCSPWKFATEINYKALRTMIGYNDKTIFIVTIDKPGMAFTAMANLMISIGCKYAINLDGGGSSRCMVEGKVINTPTENRKVDSMLAVYLNKTKEDPKMDYYLYTIKKGDSWWGIANKETGNGSNYTKIKNYNNWPSNKALEIGAKIKIPYSLKPGSTKPTTTTTKPTTPTVSTTPETPKVTKTQLGTFVYDESVKKYQILNKSGEVIAEFSENFLKK